MAHHDVLLIESQPGVAENAVRALTAAGHTVHRCHDPGAPAFPCTELTRPGSCPLNGHVDAAVLVRARPEPRPTPLEDGAICAIRAGVPLVELGPGAVDPFDPWVIRRITEEHELDAALGDAIELADGELRRSIIDRTRPMLELAGVPVDAVQIAVGREADGMTVEMQRPGEPDERLDHALAVRMYDVVRADRRRDGVRTRVSVHHLVDA